jgi:segregation and condensation protein B
VGRPGLYATTRHFLDDLGIASLDQLPLMPSVDGQAAALASLNAPAADTSQASLSLEEALEVTDAQAADSDPNPNSSKPEQAEGHSHE